MKWFKKNGILFSIFLALGLFSYFEFQKSKTLLTKKIKSEKLFFNISKKDIVAVDFYSKPNNKSESNKRTKPNKKSQSNKRPELNKKLKLDFQLKNKNNQWFVIKPKNKNKYSIKDNAKKSSVNIFLNKIFLEKKEKVSLQESLSNYELSNPDKKIIFYDSNKNKYSLSLGSESFDKKRFILIKDQKDVFLSSSSLSFIDNKNFNLFRSKKLFIISQNQNQNQSQSQNQGSGDRAQEQAYKGFDKIVIKNKKNNIILHKKNNSWKGLLNFKKNIFVKLDKAKVDKFISTFKHLEAQNFIRENKVKSKKLLQQYNLLHPKFYLSVFFKNKKIWTIKISQDDKNKFVYAKISKKTTIYSILKESYKSLKVSLNSLRDRTSVFKINKKNINKIFYQVGKRRRKTFNLLKNSQNQNKNQANNKNNSQNQNQNKNNQSQNKNNQSQKNKKFINLIASISKLKIVKFISKHKFKSQPITQSLSFIENNKPALIIQERGIISSQKNSKLNDLVVLDLQNSQEYFAVSSKQWKSLIKKFLSKPKSKPKSKSKSKSKSKPKPK